MVTDRYETAHGIQPGSVMAALGLSAAMVGGLVLSSPAVKERITTVLVGINIPLAQPTPEPTPDLQPTVRIKVQPQPRPTPIDATDTVVPTDDESVFVNPGSGTTDGIGKDPVETILPPVPAPAPAPVLTGVGLDPRYARDLQPAYPAGEQRAGHEGSVTVRVLVGADGRVEKVERVSAASDAFFAATKRQALGAWRFRPATRDGIPVEGWRTMTVRFVMPVG